MLHKTLQKRLRDIQARQMQRRPDVSVSLSSVLNEVLAEGLKKY